MVLVSILKQNSSWKWPRQVYCVQHHRDASQPRGIRVELAAMQLEEPDTDIHNGIIFLGQGVEHCSQYWHWCSFVKDMCIDGFSLYAGACFNIFIGLPAMVSHKIDYSSPLSPDVPPPMTLDAAGSSLEEPSDRLYIPVRHITATAHTYSIMDVDLRALHLP